MKQMTNKVPKAGCQLALTLFFCLMLAPGFLQAKELSEREVSAAVETWVRYVTADARVDAVVEQMEPYIADGTVAAYIAHLADSGFCLCSSQDMLPPVYYYSPARRYDSSDCHYQCILLEITSGLNKLKSGDPQLEKIRPFLERMPTYWADLIAGCVPERERPKGLWEGPDSMSLGVPDWDNHQWWPFNAHCPFIVNPAANCTLRTVDGCVAHSMSLILRYWKWPPSGEGQDQTVYDRRTSSVWKETPLSFYPFDNTWSGPGDQYYNPSDCSWDDRLEWVSTGGGKLRMKGDWDYSCIEVAKTLIEDSTSSSTDTVAYWNALENLWGVLTRVPDTLKANFAATTYQWDLMPHSRWDIDTPGEIDAVSTLTYHAGIACHMGYGVFGSSSWSSPEPYENHFRYDQDANWAELAHCDEPDTCAGAKRMVEEIQWLRAVNYCYGYPLGHAWVILGYNRLFLPDSMQFKDDAGWQTFNSAITVHPMIYYIAPENMVKFVGAASPGDGSPDDPYQNVEEAVVEAPDGVSLIFKAGSDNTFSAATLTINRPFTLKGRDVVIRRGW